MQWEGLQLASPPSRLPESTVSERAYQRVFGEVEDGCHLPGAAGET